MKTLYFFIFILFTIFSSSKFQIFMFSTFIILYKIFYLSFFKFLKSKLYKFRTIFFKITRILTPKPKLTIHKCHNNKIISNFLKYNKQNNTNRQLNKLKRLLHTLIGLIKKISQENSLLNKDHKRYNHQK